MGKIQVLTKEQQIILAQVKKEPFFEQFYFTGGTALSAFYLQHRYSEDLDFFTQRKFDTQDIFDIIDSWSKKHGFTFTSEFHQVVYIFMFTFKNNEILKVDFGHYAYKRIEKNNIIDVWIFTALVFIVSIIVGLMKNKAIPLSTVSIFVGILWKI